MAAQHLVVALSSHGYGHAAMTAPAVAALAERRPGLRVTLLSSLPEAWLRQRFPSADAVLPEEFDIGLDMASPLDVEVESTARRYVAFHADWPGRVRAAADTLAALEPDLVLANVPYLALAGAAQAGIAVVGFSSLNWLAVYRSYFGDRPEAPPIIADMAAAYRAARLFLCCSPALPMDAFGNVRRIGPVAVVGRDRGATVRRRLGLPPGRKLAVIALGGRFPTPDSVRDWPTIEDLQWLVPADWPMARPDLSPLTALDDMAFADIVRSAALLVTKPGYGLFTEAACAGTPVLFLRRGAWPEEPGLIAWIDRVGLAREIGRDRFDRGDIAEPALALLRAPRPVPVEPSGNDEAASLLLDLLDG